MPSLIYSGKSKTFSLLDRGTITSFNPSLLEANIFSLIPPIFNTLPLKDISPVIPTFYLIGVYKANDTSAEVMAIPADGPSLGTAPSGACICTSFFSKN